MITYTREHENMCSDHIVLSLIVQYCFCCTKKNKKDDDTG
jgi:hypothetical protein